MDRKFVYCFSLILTALFITISFNSAALAEIGSKNDINSSGNTRTADWEGVKSVSTTVQIDAGERFYVYFDSKNLKLEAMASVDLPTECDHALSLVPEWLRDNLTYKFRQLSPSNQVTFANLIINSPYPKYIDEIAFCIAHTSVESLQHQYFFPELLIDNAKYIYQNDQYLAYADIVEKSDYTTISYKNKTNVSLELPRDIYYWYVVHPKLSDELPTYVDPDYNYYTQSPGNKNYGVAPPTGKFWREWLFYHNDSANYSGNKKQNPLLREKLQNRYTVWEAISGINSWVSNSMKFTSDNERPIQPVRIYRKHIGRCGEHQDMRCAAARAALIPTVCTLNSAEDHVWNEFWDQRWIHWDGGCDNPMKYENGWGKKISSVWNFRGDAHIWSVTSKYTSTCTYTATVKDSAGLPVDGAQVLVATENFYDPNYLTITTWGYTDYTGTCTITLGDQRNYWSAAETDNLGRMPPGSEQVTPIITNSAIGGTYSHTFNLPQAAPKINANTATPPDEPLTKYKLDVSYSVNNNILQGKNYYTGEHCDLFGPGGDIDFFIADSTNFTKYSNDEAFDAYELDERRNGSEKSFIIPAEDTWYMVLSNEYSQRTTKIVNITVDIYGTVHTSIDNPEPDSKLPLDSLVVINGSAFSPLGLTNVEIDFDNKDAWQAVTDTDALGWAWSTWKFDWDTEGLTPGSHNIRARATDAKNTYITSINVILEDVTEPVLWIDQPINNSEFRIGEVILISGNARDNVGVTNLELIYDSDQSNSYKPALDKLTGKWSYNLHTEMQTDGLHTIKVQAGDGASNFNTSIIQITLIEVIAPVVTIADPAENSIHKPGDTIFFRGFATDNKEVTMLELMLDEDETINITSRLKSTGSWNYYLDTNEIEIAEGEHCIMIKAFDAAQNVGNASVNIALDGSPPELEISRPLDNEIVKAGYELLILGTAVDNIGIKKLEIIFDNTDHIDITTGLIGENWFYRDWDTTGLSSGLHNITIRATDLMDFQSETSIFIIIDAQSPYIEIDEVKESVLIGESIRITGTATDDIEIITVELLIDGNEPINITSSYSDLNDSWSYIWVTSGASEGIHKIKIRATDIINKRTTEVTNIRLISMLTDTDGDGMPDWWEKQYDKFDPEIDDGDKDFDRDGISNLDEYLGDDGLPDNDDYSDPTDKSSVPHKKEIKPDSEGADYTISSMVIVIFVLVMIFLICLFLLLRKDRKEEEDEGEILDFRSSAQGPMPQQPPMPPPMPLPMGYPPVPPMHGPIPPPMQVPPEEEPTEPATFRKSEQIQTSKRSKEQLEPPSVIIPSLPPAQETDEDEEE